MKAIRPATARAVSLRPRLRVQCGERVALGPGKADLLEMIAQTGSIREAAARMEMSYMRAWSLVREVNQCFREPLVSSERGGSRHGGAALTNTGRRVLALYRRMERDSVKATQPNWRTLKKLLRD